ISLELERERTDIKVSPQLIRTLQLREASMIASSGNGNRLLQDSRQVKSINGVSLEAWKSFPEFSRRTAIDPVERIKLTTAASDSSMRIVDLLCPVGKGQRALIVSPPKAGKTILMQQFAHAISTNHPEIELLILLVDERPEEVTDMRRTIRGEVFASS